MHREIPTSDREENVYVRWRRSVRAGVREEEGRRRHYNRYVSMQTLSFIRLPVRGSGGDLPGPCAFPHRTRIRLFIDARRIDRCYTLWQRTQYLPRFLYSCFFIDIVQLEMEKNICICYM